MHWLIDLNKNLAPYYILCHLVSVIYLVFSKTHKTKKILGLILTIQLLLLIEPWLRLSFKKEANTQTGFSVYYSNVHNPSTNYSALLAQIAQLNPDIVGLVEVDSRWLDNLKLIDKFPYSIELPELGSFGMALYSKYQLELQSNDLGKELAPIIITKLKIPNKPEIVFTLLHSQPPIGEFGYFYRNLYLRRAVSQIRELDFPMLVVGDFNSTYWSKPYKQFAAESGFQNAATGFGIHRTWNANWSWPLSWFAIDHILLRGGIESTHFEVQDPIGSDHFPLFAKFGFMPR